MRVTYRFHTKALDDCCKKSTTRHGVAVACPDDHLLYLPGADITDGSKLFEAFALSFVLG
jgi:hypothetical protein